MLLCTRGILRTLTRTLVVVVKAEKASLVLPVLYVFCRLVFPLDRTKKKEKLLTGSFFLVVFALFLGTMWVFA